MPNSTDDIVAPVYEDHAPIEEPAGMLAMLDSGTDESDNT